MPREIYVLDTTLRDGEQVPGAKLNLNEKLEIAKPLVRLKVDMMKVGFLSSSKGDFEAVVKVGATIINVPDVVGFAVPEQFGRLIYKINDRLMHLNPNVILSVHCHNDYS